MKIIDMLVGAYSEKPKEIKPSTDSINKYVVQHGNKPTQYFSSAAAMEAYCKECELEDQKIARQKSAIDQATGRNKEYLKAIAKSFDNLIPNEEYRVALVTETGDAHCSAWQSYMIKDKYYDAQKFNFSIPAGTRVIGTIILDKKQIIRAAMPLREFSYSCAIEYSLTLTYSRKVSW